MTALTHSNDTAAPSPYAKLARYGRCALWAFAAGAVAVLVAVDLFPQSLATRTEPYLTFAAATFVVQTLQLHIGVGCLLCFAAAAPRRQRRLAFVAAMGAALGVAPAAWSLAVRGRGAPAPAGATMRVMSLNVFLYNRGVDVLAAAVDRARPDVLVLQEYPAAIDEPLRAALAEEYPYQLRKPRDDSDGWAVFSNRPLLAPIDTVVQLNDSKRQARFAVRLGDAEVLVYALHLTCPKSLERIGQNRAEVADLLTLVANERRPVILAGDFNFTESTANAAALRAAGLRSTHDLAGAGFGTTWRYRKWPLARAVTGFRIDDVYVGPQLTCTNARVLDNAGSDHRPIIADIALAVTEPAAGRAVATAE